MNKEQIPAYVINKQIEFSQDDVTPEDITLLLDIMGFGEWGGPFQLLETDCGIQIDLKMDHESQNALSGTDSFSEKYGAVCGKAYSEGCSRILLSKKH